MSFRYTRGAPLLFSLTLACSESAAPTAPQRDVALLTEITTTGVHLDADGYLIVLNGTVQRRTAVNGTARFEGIANGNHTLAITEVAENCAVAGGNTRSVAVGAAAPAPIAFAITCTQVPLELVFASSRGGSAIELWSMKSDGGTPHVRIAEGEGFLISVSPDAARIAFNTPRAGNPEIFLVNADGSGLRNWSQHSATDSNAMFSPNGAQIVFMSQRDGNADIFTGNLDGSGITNLTRSSAAENEPHWCANGRIVYTRYDNPRQGDLFTMNADGSDVRRLTSDSVTVNTPRWSPDCRRIVFASIRHAGMNGDPRNDLDLYLINADGSGLIRLTSTPRFDVGPSWAPNGQRIAFSSERDGNSEIYVINPDGTGAVNLSRNPANDQSPFWVR